MNLLNNDYFSVKYLVKSASFTWSLLFVFFYSNAQADLTFVIKERLAEHSSILNYLKIAEDPSNKLTIKEIAKPDFQHKFILFQNFPSFIHANHTYWGKLVIENQMDIDTEWYLTFANPLNINLIDLYIFKNSQQITHQQAGTYRPQSALPSSEERFKLRFLIKHKQTLTLYIKFQNITGYPPDFHLSLQDAVYSHTKNEIINYIQLFIQGCLWMMLIYNTLVWIALREKTYVFYALYLLMIVLYLLFQNFFLFRYVTGDYPRWAVVLNAWGEEFGLIAYLLFLNSFFKTEKKFPSIARQSRLIIRLMLVKIVLNFLILISVFNLLWSDLLLNIPSLIVIILTIRFLIQINQKSSNSGKLVILGTFILIGTALIGLLASLLIINRLLNWNFTDLSYFLQAGVVIESIFFSLALGYRTSEIATQRRQAQAKTIQVQEQANSELEQKIKERVTDLQELNEELQLQKEEISALNENLEKTIDQRTRDLKNAIENLLQQNQDLEQFSHVISHNIRAPIAHILGLMSVLNKENPSDTTNLQVLTFVEQSAKNLDMIVQDLDKILGLRNNLEKIQEEINLQSVVNEVIEQLDSEIEVADALICQDLTHTPNFISIKMYVESIIFQLLSNAIRYRSPERNLEIEISSKIVNKHICLTIKDNGLGIDSKYGLNKIFGLYKRMHTHTPGKGVGLYLVKNQLEILDGYIEVATELEEGTTFKVYFPQTDF